MLSGIPSLKTLLHRQGIKLAVVRLLSCRPQNLPLLLVWWRFMPDAQNKDWVSKPSSQQRQSLWMPCRRRSGCSWFSERLESLGMWALNLNFFILRMEFLSDFQLRILALSDCAWSRSHCVCDFRTLLLSFKRLVKRNKTKENNRIIFYICECIFDVGFPP